MLFQSLASDPVELAFERNILFRNKQNFQGMSQNLVIVGFSLQAEPSERESTIIEEAERKRGSNSENKAGLEGKDR